MGNEMERGGRHFHFSDKVTYIEHQEITVQSGAIFFNGPGADDGGGAVHMEDDRSEKPTLGGQKQFLFAGGRSTEEDVRLKDREKERFMRFLSDHNMGSCKLDTNKNNRLNLVVVCFLKMWREKNLVCKSPSGGAIFRFLTEDCKLRTEVVEVSYGNKMKKWIDDKDYDMNIYIEARRYFQD